MSEPDLGVKVRLAHARGEEPAHSYAASGELQDLQDGVDHLDADERHDDPADAIDQQVALEELGGGNRPAPHALQCQRNQRDDDDRVEDDGREGRASGVARFMTFSAPGSG